jgi:tripartite-type tricarboxylate transporter receptor subunit TctC
MTKRCWRLVFLASLIAFGAQPLRAEQYPARPIRLIVPYEFGGTIDPITRILAETLGEQIGQNVVVENKPGANGNDGVAEVAGSPADGYTLGMASSGTLVANPWLYARMPFDVERDITPIVLYASLPNILVVNRSLPIKDLKQFTDYARAHPGKLSYGSTGVGSSMYLAAELFKSRTGTFMVHIPFNSPGLATHRLIEGEIDAMFQLVPGVLGQVRAGNLRPIGILADKRSSALPGVPTFAEQGLPIESAVWIMLLGPKDLPKPVVARLNRETNRALAKPALRAKLIEFGVEPLGGTIETAAKYRALGLAKWGKVLSRKSATIDPGSAE